MWLFPHMTKVTCLHSHNFMNKLRGIIKPSPEIKVSIIGTGARGREGKSAYEVWLEAGNVGTIEDFLNNMKDISIGDTEPMDFIFWYDPTDN